MRNPSSYSISFQVEIKEFVAERYPEISLLLSISSLLVPKYPAEIGVLSTLLFKKIKCSPLPYGVISMTAQSFMSVEIMIHGSKVLPDYLTKLFEKAMHPSLLLVE